MDDYRYFGRAMKPLRTPFTIDKEKIMKVTLQLLDREIVHETLQETFGAYVEACMEYSIRREAPLPCATAPYPCDGLLIPAKKISSFVTKKNVAHYVKAPEEEPQNAAPASSKPQATGSSDERTRSLKKTDLETQKDGACQVLTLDGGNAIVLRRRHDPGHDTGVERDSPVRPSGRRPGRVSKKTDDPMSKPRRAVLTETTLEFRSE